MRHPLILLSVLMLNVAGTVFSQSNNCRGLTEEQARSILNASLSDTTLHNVNGEFPLLNKEADAVRFAEMILFNVYGRKTIKRQKPYQVFNIDGYWLIGGATSSNRRGGAFLIIIDSRDNRVVRITHGK